MKSSDGRAGGSATYRAAHGLCALLAEDELLDLLGQRREAGRARVRREHRQGRLHLQLRRKTRGTLSATRPREAGEKEVFERTAAPDSWVNFCLYVRP